MEYLQKIVVLVLLALLIGLVLYSQSDGAGDAEGTMTPSAPLAVNT